MNTTTRSHLVWIAFALLLSCGPDGSHSDALLATGDHTLDAAPCASARIAHLEPSTSATYFASAAGTVALGSLELGDVVRVLGWTEAAVAENPSHPALRSDRWLEVELADGSGDLRRAFLSELHASCRPETLTPDELRRLTRVRQRNWLAPVLALDTYEKNGELTAATMGCLWGKGYRHLLANIREKRFFDQQVGAAVAKGMTADGYVYIYFDRTRQLMTDALARVVGNPAARMLWIDVEGSTNPYGATTVVAALQDAVAQCRAAGVRCGFYTSKVMWARFTADTHVFSAYPLWDARWDKVATLDNMDPYGGWTSREGKQLWGWGWSPLVACDANLHYADPDVFSVVPVARPDAGSNDAGVPPDAGAPDAGVPPDAGTPDAGTGDAGTDDAGSEPAVPPVEGPGGKLGPPLCGCSSLSSGAAGALVMALVLALRTRRRSGSPSSR